MASFFDLLRDIIHPGYCRRCGGCVAFCQANNYGALETSPEGWPQFRNAERCLECGVCYQICPATGQLTAETRRRVAWSAPIGRVMDSGVFRSTASSAATHPDGKVGLGLIEHLFATDRIDGAVVLPTDHVFNKASQLARTPDQLRALDDKGLTTSQVRAAASSLEVLGSVRKTGLRRVAFMGTPCQVETVRKMEILAVPPAERLYCTIGCFCDGDFLLGPAQQDRLEKLGFFRWNDVRHITLRDHLEFWLAEGKTRDIPLEDLDFMRRYACRLCTDYSAQFADLAVGGTGAPHGWSTVIARTPLGQAILSEARQTALEPFNGTAASQTRHNALYTVCRLAERKQHRALHSSRAAM